MSPLLLLSLALPARAASPCPAPPTLDDAWSLVDDLDDTALIQLGALRPEQVEDAMESFLPELSRCVPPGRSVVEQIEVELTVACTGRVSQARVSEPAGLDPDVLHCVERLLPLASFPAHSLPEGFRFAYAVEVWYP